MNGQRIETRDQFIDHIFSLMDDFDGAGDQWRNKDIYTFLQAMAAWLNDGKVEQPSWQLFADALSAAAIDE
jgi:hypothetical protein